MLAFLQVSNMDPKLFLTTFSLSMFLYPVHCSEYDFYAFNCIVYNTLWRMPLMVHNLICCVFLDTYLCSMLYSLTPSLLSWRSRHKRWGIHATRSIWFDCNQISWLSAQWHHEHCSWCQRLRSPDELIYRIVC